MKTQIYTLVSGRKNQLLNENRNYSIFPRSTSHNGHAGVSLELVEEITQKIWKENPKFLKIEFFDRVLELEAHWSLSEKSCNYIGYLPIDLANKFFDIPKNGTPKIIINNANTIEINNGKNAYMYVCPSLITIL